jgi:hypothetical protein
MSVRFRLLNETDLPILRSWFEDAELSRRLSFPTDDLFAHVTSPAASCWAGLDDAGEIVAQVRLIEKTPSAAILTLRCGLISEVEALAWPCSDHSS